MKSSDTHDCELFCDWAVHFGAAVGSVTELEHGEWLVRQGRFDETEPLLAEAQETFERLEATPWLERALAVRPPVQEPV